MLSADETNELGDLIEHMFDRLWYARARLEKVQGALEGLQYWWISHADSEAIHSRPLVSPDSSPPQLEPRGSQPELHGGGRAAPSGPSD